MQLPDGEIVIADERLYLVRVDDQSLSRDNLTALEQEVMAEHRWWTDEELSVTDETVYPENVRDLVYPREDSQS
jgi:hypothetical protein